MFEVLSPDYWREELQERGWEARNARLVEHYLRLSLEQVPLCVRPPARARGAPQRWRLSRRGDAVGSGQHGRSAPDAAPLPPATCRW